MVPYLYLSPRPPDPIEYLSAYLLKNKERYQYPPPPSSAPSSAMQDTPTS